MRCSALLTTWVRYPPSSLLEHRYPRPCGASALPAQLKSVNFSCTELKEGGFSAKALEVVGFNAAQLKIAGFRARQIKDTGLKASNVFELAELKLDGFTVKELRGEEGFSLSDLKECFSANELRRFGDCEPGELLGVGFSMKQMREGGFSAFELRKAGYGARPSVDDAVDAMRGDERFRAKLTLFAKHGLDRHAEFFDAPLSEAEVLEGHSLIMRGLRGADSLWRRCVPDYDLADDVRATAQVHACTGQRG